MRKQNIKTLNPISWLLFGLGACSASSKVESLIPTIPQEAYAFSCKSGNDTVGVSDMGGAGRVYKNGVVQFANHRGSDFSVFFVTQYPTDTLPLQAFSMQNDDAQALEYYSLVLEMNLVTAQLSIEEQRYVRDMPGAIWEFDSKQEVLAASDCIAN